MTEIKIDALIWDKWNITHIKKHSVTRKRVEIAIRNIRAHRQGYRGRIVLIGKSGRRLISVIVVKKQLGKYYVVTARDADKKERRLIYEKEKKNS